jgi:hypothetical protein
MKKMFLLFFLAFSILFAEVKECCGLSKKQISLLQKAYSIAKKYKSNDGHTFEDTIVAIYLVESNAGKHLIGDKYYVTGELKSLYESSLGPGQIKLSTALLVINSFDNLKRKYGQLYHKDYYAFKKYVPIMRKLTYYKSVLNNPIWKKRWAEGKKLKVKAWAEREYKYWLKKIKPYIKYIKKDDIVIDKLLYDEEFSIEISLHYLILNYNVALKRKYYNPWFKSISRYNGGWKNTKYYKRVLKKMKIVRRLKQKGYLK